MPFRAILVAAAIAMATIGVASPASAVPECMGPDYINSDGVCVHDPEQVPKGSPPPPGATAICADGDYSFSKHTFGDEPGLPGGLVAVACFIRWFGHAQTPSAPSAR